MKVEIALLLLAVTVCVQGFSWGGRSEYDCRRRCGYGRRYVCSTDGTTYDNECLLKCNYAFKSCDGRCPCYRPPTPVVYRPKPVVNYRPRQPVSNDYDRRQSANYEPRPLVNYERTIVNNVPAAVNFESAAVNYPDYDPAPVYTEPAPEYTEPAPVYYDVPVKGDCFCGKDKDYVCTYDGETYDNECEAICDGKVKRCDNQCPCT